jgi:ribosomal protein L37AE/L43A
VDKQSSLLPIDFASSLVLVTVDRRWQTTVNLRMDKFSRFSGCFGKLTRPSVRSFVRMIAGQNQPTWKCRHCLCDRVQTSHVVVESRCGFSFHENMQIVTTGQQKERTFSQGKFETKTLKKPHPCVEPIALPLLAAGHLPIVARFGASVPLARTKRRDGMKPRALSWCPFPIHGKLFGITASRDFDWNYHYIPRRT